MRLALVLPVLNKPEVTAECIEFLDRTIIDPSSFVLVIVDNGSKPPLDEADLPHTRFPKYVIRKQVNRGYYKPLRDGLRWDFEITALMHNDVFIYEVGWDRRLREAFVHDDNLGIVGFCGSSQVDGSGGRGGGTMMHFRGERGQKQAGEIVLDLKPAAILDSLFMAFRSSVAEDLLLGEEPTPAHFYDKIWPMRAIEKGWRVAVLGVEIDHMGGTTLVAEPQFWHDMAKWCKRNGVNPGENPTLAVYVEAERRWLTEFRQTKGLMPGAYGHDWIYRRV